MKEFKIHIYIYLELGVWEDKEAMVSDVCGRLCAMISLFSHSPRPSNTIGLTNLCNANRIIVEPGPKGPTTWGKMTNYLTVYREGRHAKETF